MTSDNSLIVGDGDLSIPRESADLSFFSIDERGQEVEVEVQPLDQRFRLIPDESPILIIGRSTDCDITLPDSQVSYRHAYLQLVGGQVHCVDLASRTGSFWGSRKRRSGWLLPEQAISIGPYSISHASLAAVPSGLGTINLLSRKSRDDYQARSVELTFLNGRNDFDGLRSSSLTEPITLLGNSSRCRLRIDHPSVSRVHCSLMVTPAGLWITDLLGKGGTWVNGERIAFQLLDQGDEICIGEIRFQVNYQDELENTHSRDRAGGVTQPAPPRPPDRLDSGYTEDFILSLMDRFTAMQQQMSAASQQQMMFMAQLVGTMHQNHHDVVQQELARINKIGEQIQQLQSRIHDGDRAASESVLSLDKQPASATQSEPKRLPEQSAETPAVDTPETRCDDPVAAAEIDDPAVPPAENDVAQAQAWRHASDRDDDSEDDDPVNAGQTVSTSPRYAPHEVQDHSQLIERMTSLESERSSRWKKIMRIITGTGP